MWLMYVSKVSIIDGQWCNCRGIGFEEINTYGHVMADTRVYDDLIYDKMTKD